MRTLPLTFLAAILTIASIQNLSALDAGDCMVVGYDSTTPDSVSFVTWVELASGTQITILDADYDGNGNGIGQGTSGGTYSGNSDAMVWTNSSGSAVQPGTVIVVQDDGSANIGSASGSLPLTAGGEQFFLAQGSLNGADNFIGDLLFGIDFEQNATWGEAGESELPGALDTATGNLTFGHQNRMQYIGPRDGLPLSAYPALIADPNNWQLATTALSVTGFEELVIPPEPVPDRLGAVSTGLIFHADRLNNEQPIIDEAWMLSQGATASEADNINGSHCIRLPDWLPAADRAHPSALYYLYFADHNGNFIRMAWAANLEGPWTGYRMDANLPLQDRGVLSLGTDDEITPGNDLLIDGHIASPQVFADDANQQFVMYFHAPTEHDGNDKGQSTFAATSSDGLNFNMPADGGQPGHGVQPLVLGESYFRIFDDGTDYYAFSNTGDIWLAPDPANLYTAPAGYDYSKDYWDRGPNVYTDGYSLRGWDTLRPRHFGVLQRDGLVYAFLTNKEGAPERIFASTFDFSQLPEDYNDWTLRFPHQEVLRPETTWEGANFPVTPSDPGSEDDGVNELRDPAVLADTDGRTYLFYSGQGEDAIGLARLYTAPVVTGNTQTTRGQSHTFTISNDVDVTTAVRRISHATPADLDLDAETPPLPFNYSGSGNYPTTQSHTVASDSNAFHLAHTTSGAYEILTLPERYYARPGATLSFSSRLGNSSTGQIASIQISIDGTSWQDIWIEVGGTAAGIFSTINVDLDGLAGQDFGLRLVYRHEPLFNTTFSAGFAAGTGTGWFIDNITSDGLELVQVLDEQPFTANTFTLADIDAAIAPVLIDGSSTDDRFLISASGDYSSDSTGFGKPFVFLIRTSYEQFVLDEFTTAQQSDPQIIDPDADPDADGLANLLEHAFGTDPETNNSNPMCITSNRSLTFPWNPSADYTYQLEVSTDLADFDDLPFTAVIATGNLLQITATPSAPYDNLPRAFFRLKVIPK